ncbi:MAG TPA: LptF/LptG family permease [Melioribacteraceae bacterium]|nr:LptF/LptG family permease [Melioribacteraceae bacterium]
MKILDRYLIKQFVQTILFGLLAFTLLFVLIDLMEKLDDFIDHNVPNYIILQYYVVFIPEILRLMIPVAVLLSALFTAGKLANLNELTAIRSAGISLFRFMLPFIITAFIISLFSIYFGGYVVPYANKHLTYLEQNFMNKNVFRAGNNIYFQDTKTRIVSISFFDVVNNVAHRVSIQEFDKNDITKMTARIDAIRMQYNFKKKFWVLKEGTSRVFYNDRENLEKFSRKEIEYLNFIPEDVIKKQRKPEEMTLPELYKQAIDEQKAGNDSTRTWIDYHSRIAFAFSSIIVVLFGLPISSNKRRGGVALQFGVNLLITFLYLVFMKISQAFGKNGVMDPVLTAWFANFVFLIAAVYNIFRSRS